MSKKKTVAVTIRVPKSLLALLEAEEYLGWKPEDFFETAIRSAIGVTTSNMSFEEMEQFYKKYGENVDVIHLKSTRVVDC